MIELTDELPPTDGILPAVIADKSGTEEDRLVTETPLDGQAQPTESQSATDSPESVDKPEPEVGGETTKPVKPVTRKLSREDRLVYERAVRRFQACSRCGYLLVDCRLALGEEALQKAILAAQKEWLQIEGSEVQRSLLIKAFGIRLDQGFDYYDGMCPECRRRFVFSSEESGRTQLQIMI